MKIAAALIAGIILTVIFYETRTPSVPPETKKEFQEFSTGEARAYAEATDPDEKLKAAEALYGKMMVLFLANLGLELRKDSPAAEKFDVNVEEGRAHPVVAEAAAAKAECAPCTQATAAQEKKKEEQKKLTTAEKFKSAPYAGKSDAVIRKMRGTFYGKLSYFAGTRRGKIDGALMEVNLGDVDGKLAGSIAVILSDENNEPYSRNRGNGGNKTIRYNESEKTVYVEASPDSFFAFRAKEFDGNEVSGEYYEDNAMVGKALLFRQ